MVDIAIAKVSNVQADVSVVAQRHAYGQTSFQSYDNDFSITPEEVSHRLTYLWDRLMRIELHIDRKLTCTVKEMFIDSDIRKQVSKKILKKLYKQIRNIARTIMQRYDEIINHPKIKATLKFREDYINLKVANFVLKFFRANLKLLIQVVSGDELNLTDFEQSVKSVGVFARFAAKVVNFKDLSFDDFRRGLPKAALKCFKVFYNIIKIPVSAIEIANKNPLCLLAYEAAGLGSSFQPFTGIAVEFASILSTPIACLKLISKTGILLVAWYELYQEQEGDSSYAEKQFSRNKAFISWATEVSKFAVKMTIISATGFISLWLIPIGSATAAAMGMWQYYQSLNNSSSVSIPNTPSQLSIADSIDDHIDSRPDVDLPQRVLTHEDVN